MTFWKGSWRGSQEDSRKKEEGCVQDPEEEKAAGFRASRVERSKVSRTSNKPKAGRFCQLGTHRVGQQGHGVEWL